MRQTIHLPVLLTAIIIFSACASTLPPAGPSPKPMEKADSILIQTSDSPQSAYQKMYRLLMDRGFGIERYDDGALTLLTTTFDLKKMMGDSLATSTKKAQLNVRIREDNLTVILLTGWYGYEDTSTDYQFDNKRIAGNPFSTLRGGEIANYGQKDSLSILGWQLMSHIAESYPGGQLFFARNR